MGIPKTEREILPRIESLLKAHPKGLTTSAITRHLKGNRNSTAKYLGILLSSGIVECKHVGASKVYSHSKKVSFNFLLNHTSELILILSGKGTIISVNDSMLNFFQERKESFEGKQLAEIPFDLFQILCKTDNLMNPDSETITEVQCIVSGDPAAFKARCIPIVFGNGEPGYAIFLENISERIKYEKHLAASESKYRAVVEDQPDLICRRRMDGTVTFANPAFLKFFKKTTEQLEGTTFFPNGIMPGMNYNHDIPAILPYMKDYFEQCILRGDGNIRWLQWRNTPLTAASGDIAEIQSVGRDITIQRQREKEILLKKSSVESSEYAIVLFDLMARISYANRRFYEVFGCPHDQDLSGTYLEQFIMRSTVDSNVRNLEKTLRETGRFDGFVRGTRADGTELDVEIHTTAILNDPYFPLHGLAVLRDRTGNLPAGAMNNTPLPQRPLKGVLIADPAGFVLTANKDFLALSGYGGESDLTGRPVSGIIGCDILAGKGGSSDPSHQEEPGKRIIPLPHKNGRSVSVEVTSRAITAAQGKNIGYKISIVSVAPLMVSTEEELGLYPFPTFAVDREKKVILWNPPMEEFTRIKKEEILGTDGYLRAFYPYYGMQPSLVDLIDFPLDKAHRIYPDLIKIGDTIFLDRYIPDSTTGQGMHLCEKAGLLVDEHGNITGTVGSFYDISEWKRSQEFMSAMREDLEKNLQAKIRFLLEGQVSHES